MNLEKIIAVTGASGLFKLVVSRSNGLILEHLITKKRKFFTSRSYQFTPLESIALFTDDDSTPLKKVFQSMIDQMEDNPVLDLSKASKEDVKEYFEDVLPNYDRDKLFINDMKKTIKWFKILQSVEFFNGNEGEEETKEEKEEV